MKKNIVIGVLIVIILIMGGTLFYLNFNKEKITSECPKKQETSNEEVNKENEKKQELTSISGNYIYDEQVMPIEQHLEEVPQVIEIKLNMDNTFIAYISSTGSRAIKGEYVMRNNKIKLYALEENGVQEEPLDVTNVNSDTVELTYNDKENTLTFEKWVASFYNEKTHRVEYKSILDKAVNVELKNEKQLKHIGIDRYQF